MRTRFLNADYFTSSPVETLNFLNLTVPHIPHSRLFNSNVDDLLRFDSVLNLPLEIELLTIDAALSKFLSDVIPHFIDAEYEGFDANRSGNGNVCFDEKSSFSSLDARFSEKDNETATEDKDSPRFNVIQFEIPELDILLKDACLSEKEEFRIFSEVPEIDNYLDMIMPELIKEYPNEAQQAIYSVDNVSSEYHIEQKSSVSEDDGSFQDQVFLQHSGFSLLEVDELSLTTLTSQSLEDELLSVLEHQNWNEKDLPINGKELLGTMEYDILEFLSLSDNCQSKQCLESELASLDMFVEMNIINMVEISQVEGISAFHQANSDVDCFSSMSPVTFQEFQILDVDTSQNFEVFLCTQTTDKPETCDWMFREDTNFKNFSELIVSHELTLADDTFKSLPTPILSGYEKIKSLYAIIEEILLDLKPQTLSASDGIYLDWYLLEEDKCNHKIYSSYQNMLKEIDSRSINFDWEPSDDGKLVFDFIFSDDALNGPNIERYKESLNVHSDSISVLDVHLNGVTSGELLDSGCPKPGNEEHPAEINAERASSLFKSMSEFNDLDFFLNPLKAAVGGNTKTIVESSDAKATYPKVPSCDPKAPCMSSGLQLKQWDVIFYNVKLSDRIVALIDNFEKSYLAILQNETELSSFLAADNFKLLSIPKEKLMDCIKKKIVRRTSSHEDENIMAFVTLCAIKQMACYMCFYGFHVTHLYLDKLCQSLDPLKSLSFLKSLIEGAHGEVDKKITRSHPSLSVIQGIIQSNTSQSSFKVLILAEQVFWCSLKRLLMSTGLSCNELHSFYTQGNQPNVFEATESTKAKTDALLISDCLLVSHEQVSACFPFDKFSLILEYGGSYGSSRISSPSPNLCSLPRLHFIKVELDNSSAASALCGGVDMPQNIKMTMENESNSLKALDEIINYQRLEELLNFVPLDDKCNIRSSEGTDKIQACYNPLPFAMEPELIQQRIVSFPNSVIIVNTQNLDKEMIVSRRSTYQKILDMEKEGTQVVERDSDLPVDLMLSSAICLVWYDCRNMGKKATALNEASSCLPLFIDNIAANILTLLSFTFSCCILLFEGESSFLATVMEFSDELYAAAASLGIDLQLFCSYSADLSDEIILSCIRYAVKLPRGLCPKMRESETLAESFLTKFPSVNPLTANAILSSGGMLSEFLELSHEQRICAMQKYYVPDESVTLFSALCRYGERDDSKSIMTDCSSSVSSGPDSDKCHFNVDSERKRKKYIGSPQKIDINLDDLLHFKQLNKFSDGTPNPSGVFKPYDFWMSKDPKISDEYRTPGSSLDGMLDQKQALDFAIEKNPSRVSRPYGSQIYKGPQVPNEINTRNIPSKDKLLGKNLGSEMAMMVNMDWQNINNSENLQEDFIGEVIDLTNSPLSGEDFPDAAKSIYFSPLVPEMEQDFTRKSKIARRLSFDSFGKSSHPRFPTAAEINSGSYIFGSVKDPRQNFQRINDHPDIECNSNKLPSKRPKSLLEEILAQGSAGFKGLSFKEEISYSGGTPLSDAIRSAHPQPGSPWTIEFLNRIREKSRLRQQALPCDTSAPCVGTSGNVSKFTKRKSPSILEFFKYQGGCTPRKISEQKKQKQSIKASTSSKNERSSTSFLSSCTPIDKRERKTLTLAPRGSGSQTKLVWSDGSAHGLNKKFQNQ